MLQYVSRILGRAGYRLLTAPDADSAMATLARETFDLVILDLWLPDSGFELLTQVIGLGGPPVIVYTAEASEAYRQRALDLGAADYLIKPVPSPELLERIHAALENSDRGPSNSALDRS